MTVGAAIAVLVALAIPTSAYADTPAPPNTLPVADSQTVAVYQNTPFPVTLTGKDSDPGDSISYKVLLASGPSHGTLENGVTALHKYTPSANYTGPDSFQFQTVDSHGALSAIATVTITVIPATQPNRPPAPTNQAVSTPLNTAIKITLTGTDPDGDLLNFLLNDPKPQHGTLTGSTPNLTYTPAPGYVGTDTFGFKVDDGKAQSPAPGIITITVAKPNTPPVATNISAWTIQNRPVGVSLGGSDPDGDTFTFNTPSDPAHGTVALTGTPGRVVYTPDRWFNGLDTFTYTVTDSKGATSAPATVSVVVRGFKHRPIAYDQSVATGVRQPVKIVLNGWSGDGDDLDFAVIDGPDHGRLIQQSDGVVIYVPDRHFRGYDSFDFVVRDEDGRSSRPATVDIKVKSYWGGYHLR
ncbi:Ig-like domain-containing protein [uncultured Amnibacterium sp.]|uniref:Ig-like domain-containing protein n=1 Tax=uncultured Amnibacterium sp. TaxID=1631851 RepID=UPI0035CAD73A